MTLVFLFCWRLQLKNVQKSVAVHACSLEVYITTQSQYFLYALVYYTSGFWFQSASGHESNHSQPAAQREAFSRALAPSIDQSSSIPAAPLYKQSARSFLILTRSFPRLCALAFSNRPPPKLILARATPTVAWTLSASTPTRPLQLRRLLAPSAQPTPPPPCPTSPSQT